MTFTLIGHDCPSGDYPSPIVPVGMVDGVLHAAFRAAQSVELLALGPDVKFNRHSEAISKALADFDVELHELFAITPDEIEMYEADSYPEFLSELLDGPHVDLLSGDFRFIANAVLHREVEALKALAVSARTAADTCEPITDEWYRSVVSDAYEQGALEDSFPEEWRILDDLSHTLNVPDATHECKRARLLSHRLRSHLDRLIPFVTGSKSKEKLRRFHDWAAEPINIGFIGTDAIRVLDSLICDRDGKADEPLPFDFGDGERIAVAVSLEGRDQLTDNFADDAFSSERRLHLNGILRNVKWQFVRISRGLREVMHGTKYELCNVANLIAFPLNDIANDAPYRTNARDKAIDSCELIVFAPSKQFNEYDAFVAHEISSRTWIGAFPSAEARDRYELVGLERAVVGSFKRVDSGSLWRRAEAGLVSLEALLAEQTKRKGVVPVLRDYTEQSLRIARAQQRAVAKRLPNFRDEQYQPVNLRDLNYHLVSYGDLHDTVLRQIRQTRLYCHSEVVHRASSSRDRIAARLQRAGPQWAPEIFGRSELVAGAYREIEQDANSGSDSWRSTVNRLCQSIVQFVSHADTVQQFGLFRQRDRLYERLVEEVGSRRVEFVVGHSGTGKSMLSSLAGETSPTAVVRKATRQWEETELVEVDRLFDLIEGSVEFTFAREFNVLRTLMDMNEMTQLSQLGYSPLPDTTGPFFSRREASSLAEVILDLAHFALLLAAES